MQITVEHEVDEFNRWLGRLTREMSGPVLSQTLRKIALDFLRQVIDITPIDTGRAQGGWLPYLRANGVIIPVGGDPQAAARGAAESGFREKLTGREQEIVIINGVVYIRRLEFGWSDQAPQGFVRITLQKMRREIDETALEAVDDALRKADRGI